MSIEAFEKIQVMVIKAGGVFTALFIVGIYFSTSLAIILSIVVGLLWLLSGQFIGLPGVLKKYSVALWALLLYGCFIVGLSYGGEIDNGNFTMISKYRELFFIPVLISSLAIERHRYWAWHAFIVASIVALLFSYLLYFEILNLSGYEGHPYLKGRISHSIFIAFFAFFCMHRFYSGAHYAKVYLGLSILSIHNLFFVVEGRTGQLIVVGLVLLFAMQRLTTKKRLLTVAVVTVLLALFLNFSDKADRISEGVANTQAYLQAVPEQTESSMGQRYTFWKYSLKLMAEKPLLGHGTGSFVKEYQRIAVGESLVTQNPHNEFLMIGVQLGLVGLLVYLGFLASQFYSAGKLPDSDKWLAQGLLVSLVITSLFNTPIFDLTEGHWYAVMIALCFAALGSGKKVVINNV